MSREWIDAVSETRFKDREWKGREKVRITTLDRLMAENGIPDFCKIDVEGFEPQVLMGLTSPIPCLSFEYTIPEKMDSVEACLTQLGRIGNYECNYTRGEQMKFELTAWVSGPVLLQTLRDLSSAVLFGDVYVRFKP